MIGIAVISVGFGVWYVQDGLLNFGIGSGGQTEKVDIKKDPDLELHTTSDEITAQEQNAIEHVQAFRGSDSAGPAVAEVLADIVSSKYPDDVIKDADTKIGWSSFTNPEKEGLYGVVFSFKSTNDEFSLVWYVDNTSGEIIPVGEGAKALMQVLEQE